MSTPEEEGKKLAEILMLRKKRNGRWNTTWGDKSDLGLYLTVKRLIKEAEDRIRETFDPKISSS